MIAKVTGGGSAVTVVISGQSVTVALFSGPGVPLLVASRQFVVCGSSATMAGLELAGFAGEDIASWFESLPVEDWTSDYARAIPVRWDSKLGWVDDP